MKLGSGVPQLHFVIGDCGFGSLVVGLGGIQCFARVRVVKSRQQLPFIDMRTLVEEYAGHTAGDFRGDGGAAARRNVAAGVEQRFAAAVVS